MKQDGQRPWVFFIGIQNVIPHPLQTIDLEFSSIPPLSSFFSTETGVIIGRPLRTTLSVFINFYLTLIFIINYGACQLKMSGVQWGR